MRNILMSAVALLLVASCASQPGKPWLSADSVARVEPSVIIGQDLHDNYDLNVLLSDADRKGISRTSTNCNIDNPYPYDPFNALLFYVLAEVPVCGVAKLVKGANKGTDAESSSVNSEQIDRLTKIKTDMATKLQRELSGELDQRFSGREGSSDSAISLKVKISNLYLHPKSRKLQNYQMVATLTFCIMDSSQNIAAYTNLVEAAGKYRSIADWLQITPENINREISAIAKSGAADIVKVLTRKPLSDVFFEEGRPKSCQV